MQTVKQSDLTFHRAGSDFLGHAWSCHVSGMKFVKGERYLIERPDGTTHVVGCVGYSRMDGVPAFHLVEEDGLLLMGY